MLKCGQKNNNKYNFGTKEHLFAKDRETTNIFCSFCGEKINNTSTFCSKCGEKIK